MHVQFIPNESRQDDAPQPIPATVIKQTSKKGIAVRGCSVFSVVHHHYLQLATQYTHTTAPLQPCFYLPQGVLQGVLRSLCKCLPGNGDVFGWTGTRCLGLCSGDEVY